MNLKAAKNIFWGSFVPTPLVVSCLDFLGENRREDLAKGVDRICFIIFIGEVEKWNRQKQQKDE